jgi:ABC-2 type transport system permease protein
MSTKTSALKYYRSPATVIGRFTAKRSMRNGVIWGAVFGLLVTTSALTYAAAYTTLASREKLAATFGNNVGLKAILGAPYNLQTTAGFTGWRSLGTIIIVGGIWAILTASKTLRGEEAAGRWELFLTGQTTARRATANVLAGLGCNLVLMYVIVAIITTGLGKVHTVDFTTSASLFFALAAVASATEFLAVGALASQLMPTRARAAALTAGVFGLSFALRAIGNIANSTHWLLYISPLGWIQQLRALTGSHAIWFVPIAIFTIVMAGLAIFIAGKRDLGESIVTDKDTAAPKMSLLNHPLPFAWRVTRAATLGWLAGLLIFSTVFSTLAKTAGQAFSDSSGAAHVIGKISHANTIGAKTFLGIIFLLIMTIIMLFVISGIASVREDEAQGYVDNLLVLPVSRLRWLSGRIMLLVLSIVGAGLLVSVGSWIGSSSVHSGVAIHDLLLAGTNAMAPATFMLGVGILLIGYRPRLTSTFLYGLVAWSFLVQIIGSVGSINHYILDTSILHDIALSPIVQPDWRVFVTLVGLGLVGCLLGIYRFNSRDLESE